MRHETKNTKKKIVDETEIEQCGVWKDCHMNMAVMSLTLARVILGNVDYP